MEIYVNSHHSFIGNAILYIFCILKGFPSCPLSVFAVGAIRRVALLNQELRIVVKSVDAIPLGVRP